MNSPLEPPNPTQSQQHQPASGVELGESVPPAGDGVSPAEGCSATATRTTQLGTRVDRWGRGRAVVRRVLRQTLVALLIAHFWFGPLFAIPNAYAQLPPESALPGVRPRQSTGPAESALPGTTPVATSPLTLPAETELPGQRPVVVVDNDGGEATAPSSSQAGSPPLDPNRTQMALVLPSESTLPPTAAGPGAGLNAAAGGAGQADTGAAEVPKIDPANPQPANVDDRLAWLRQSIDQQPWLRLQTDGHLSRVRTLAFSPDSQSLISGGEDKQLFVWGAHTDSPQAWPLHRTIRWQVQRGPRGRIYAADARNDRVAFAGYGAMTGLGEIVIVNHRTGELLASLEPEAGSNVIFSLAISPAEDREALLAGHLDGKVVYWQRDLTTGQWSSRNLQLGDKQAYPERTAPLVRDFAHATLLDARWAVAPVLVDPRSTSVPAWKLRLWDVGSAEPEVPFRDIAGLELTGQVTALAASPDGRRIAVADESGQVFVWDRQQDAVRRLTQLSDALTISLAFGSTGNDLLLGTTRTIATGDEQAKRAYLQRWNLADWQKFQRAAERRFPDAIRVCRVSRDGKAFAISQDNGVIIGGFADLNANIARLGPPWRIPVRVAFPQQAPFYDIAVDYGAGTAQPTSYVFSTDQLQLNDRPADAKRTWLQPELWRGNWTIKVERDERQVATGVWLERGGKRAGRLPLNLAIHGLPSATFWLPNAQGQPAFVAVGTAGDNSLFVFGLVEAGIAPLVRQYRGHASPITSISASFDMRYLASSSEDGTVSVWEWNPRAARSRVEHLWGSQFPVVDNQLTIANLRPNGPLYIRGLRNGDVIKSLTVPAREGGSRVIEEVAELQQLLQDPPRDTEVTFATTRGLQEIPATVALPAWQPIANLYVSDQREWAYWSPTGYYDASFEGHRLFGWQINRGLQQLPEFFLAAQFRQIFERPDIMGRLLTAGDIENAFTVAALEPPANPHESLADYYRLKPEIRIESPQLDTDVAGNSARILAHVRVRAGQRLVEPQAYANGIAAGEAQLVDHRREGDFEVFQYRWRVLLPSDEELLFQVVASTDTEIADLKSTLLSRTLRPPRRQRKIYLVAAGVNAYEDARIPDLEFAARNAEQFAATIRQRSASMYDVQETVLLNENVSRPMWQSTLHKISQRMQQEAGPDDLLLIFMSGHGVRDERTQDYYFIPANADYGRVMAGQYEACLSFSAMSAVADIPCRKVVILDTCHSGAVTHSIDGQNLKAAVRTLQDGLFLTLTASEGSQPSAESRDLQLGRYTYRLIQGLQGKADGANGSKESGSKDNVVTLDELASYVRTTVALDTSRSQPPQRPTAGPQELLRVSRIPLVRVANSVAVVEYTPNE